VDRSTTVEEVRIVPVGIPESADPAQDVPADT